MSYQTPISIEKTLQKIESHEIVLPAIQREFVLQPEQICALFDSLMQGYPFGTFLYWTVKQQNNNRYKFYDFVLNYHERDRQHCPLIGEMPSRDVVAVLDGQQRLTALNIGLRGSLAKKLPYKRRNSNDAYPTQYLYLNLLWVPPEDDGNEMQYKFEFLTSEQASSSEECWFRVAEILTIEDTGPSMTKILQDRNLGDQLVTAHKVLYKLFEVVRKPLVANYNEDSQELVKVLQIFIRTNSGGTVLSYSDLLLSVATAQWVNIDAREEIHQTVDDLNRIGVGFNFSKDWILKAGLMLADIGSVGFKVQNFNRHNMEVLEKKWPKIKETLSLTVKLVSSFGFSASTLSADSGLLPIAYYLHVKSADSTFLTSDSTKMDRKNIRQWLIASLLKPSRIWGSGLDSLLTALRQVISDNPGNFPVDEIRETMRSRGKPLTFDDEEIDDLTEMLFGDKRIFSLLSLIFPHLDLRQHFHIDHIFPKSRFSEAKLRNLGFTNEEGNHLMYIVNGLPNLQLLQSHENLIKRDMLPAAWLQTFETDELRQQYINIHLLSGMPLGIEDFQSFYEARRERLKRKIAKLL